MGRQEQLGNIAAPNEKQSLRWRPGKAAVGVPDADLW